MQAKIKYEFNADLWQHESPGGWYFVSLPIDISKEIRAHMQWQEEGWGRMKVAAELQEIKWDTAIWFDKKRDTYLLPIKSDIRAKARLSAGDALEVAVFV